MDHHDDENRWDYDCPQFVDFTMPMPFNDGADQLFERAVVGEGARTCSAGSGSFNQETEDLISEEQKTDGAENEKTEEVEPKSEEPNKAKQPSNIVTSLDKWRNPRKHAATGPDESPNSKRLRRNGEKTAPEPHKPSTQTSALTRSKSLRIAKSSSASCLQTKTAAKAAVPSGSKPARTLTCSQGRSRSNSVDLGPDGKSKADHSTTERPAKMPTVLKRLGDSTAASKGKSSEQMELERIKQLKKELQHKRQLAQESYKKAMSKAVPMAVHSRDPTVPHEFHFQTDKRLKSQPDKVEERGPGDFVKSLRSRTVTSPGPSTSTAKKLTLPQPFHLTEKYNTKGHTSESKFESMAEKVTAFHKKTPDRFRARARSGEKTRGRGARSESPTPRLTQPHTPNLTARSRHRPTHCLSQEQLEALEVEDMKQNQFKARPVNNKVLANPGIGVKKVAPRPPTEIEEFSLSSAAHKKKNASDEPEHFEFHAKPLNKKILEGPVGVKAVKPAMPTVPQSPAFALKNRVRLPVELPEDKPENGAPVRAKPVPHTGIPFQPKLPHQHTVPEPFTVEERSKLMLAQKEEKIRQVLEEERRAREFYAQPLPSLEEGGLPEKMVKEPTVPEPFQLETDQRGAYYAQELAHKVGRVQLSEEEEEAKRAAQFRAQPNRTIYKEPFVPARSTKPLTEVSDFELNSDRRAQQREDFELRKKEREAELEGHRRQREQREKEEEEVAIAKLRAEMVHRPNPIRHFAPVVVKPSDKPLTDAESPHFSDRLRAKVRL